MPEIPRTKFNSPWTVANIEAALNDVSSAKGSSESLTAALNAMRAEINSLSGGVHLKGAVDYYNDLPASPTEGDAYTVRYQGTSGTDPLGIEYAWATYQGTPQWIPIGVDPSVFAKQTEMDVVANAGAKNLLPMTHTNGSITRYGVTCTWDSNSGTMTINGTHRSEDSSSIFEFYDGTAENTTILPVGAYVLTGCPVGGSTATYRAALSQITGAVDIGNGANFELSEPHYAAYRILISGNVTFNNTVFKPMIRPAAITDATFQPYAPTNRELYTGELQNNMTSLVDNLNVTFIDKSNSRLNVYKYGKICFADISLKTNSSALTGADTITTTAFPSELRPTSTIYASLTARDAGSWALANLAIATVTIDANGVATIRTGAAHSSVEYITGYISWLAAN